MSVIDTFSLKNKVALVTGGAGLCGRQIVQALAEAEARTYHSHPDALAGTILPCERNVENMTTVHGSVLE